MYGYWEKSSGCFTGPQQDCSLWVLWADSAVLPTKCLRGRHGSGESTKGIISKSVCIPERHYCITMYRLSRSVQNIPLRRIIVYSFSGKWENFTCVLSSSSLCLLAKSLNSTLIALYFSAWCATSPFHINWLMICKAFRKLKDSFGSQGRRSITC